ncbi:MAG: hypothetical protein KGO92_08740 [Bacteroidota bacterium]|nr:hypothetical protein [Bacteroidota bacterium]
METGNSPYKKLTWTNFMMLHWIINPGLFVNELILGQRVPKEMWIEKNSSKPLSDKTWIPCPHCHTLHDGRTWSGRNGTAFKNWFGLYCPACGGIIPCLTNGVSAIILGISYPIRIIFWDRWKQNWLQKQPARYQNIRLENQVNPYEGAGWIRQGLSFGFFMYLMMELIIPFVTAEKITLHRLVTGVPVWVISGLLFGYFMKLFMGGRSKARTNS